MMAFLKSRRPGEVATVPPVVAEIEYGIRRIEEKTRKRILLEGSRDRLLGLFRILPWTPEASTLFGSFKADLERTGMAMDDLDVAIAAIAAAHGAEIVTANLVHFKRIAGLESRHWKIGSEDDP